MKKTRVLIMAHGPIPNGRFTALSGLILFCGLLIGCMSQSRESDPYDGLSCKAKVAKMTQELQEYEASNPPLAKASAEGTIPADTTRIPLDTAKIQLFRGFPPVAGMTGTDTTHLGGSMVDSRPIPGTVSNGNSGGVVWIPPVGFSDSGKTVPSIPLPDSTAPVPETTAPKTFPGSITAVQIISSGKYKAQIRILDYKRDLVREFDQEFGNLGELQNPSRVVAGGLVSYLVWDNRTAAGEQAMDGVYLWEVRITLESGQVQNMSTKTGLLGDECTSKL